MKISSTQYGKILHKTFFIFACSIFFFGQANAETPKTCTGALTLECKGCSKTSLPPKFLQDITRIRLLVSVSPTLREIGKEEAYFSSKIQARLTQAFSACIPEDKKESFVKPIDNPTDHELDEEGTLGIWAQVFQSPITGEIVLRVSYYRSDDDHHSFVNLKYDTLVFLPNNFTDSDLDKGLKSIHIP